MVRPKIERRIVKKPEYDCLIHGDISREDDLESIKMNLDEFEAIRLGDYHNIKQKEAAELMGIQLLDHIVIGDMNYISIFTEKLKSVNN